MRGPTAAMRLMRLSSASEQTNATQAAYRVLCLFATNADASVTTLVSSSVTPLETAGATGWDVTCQGNSGTPGCASAQILVAHNDSAYTVRWVATTEILQVLREAAGTRSAPMRRHDRRIARGLALLLVLLCLSGPGRGWAFEIQPRSLTKSGFPAPSGAPLTAAEYDNALFGLASLGLARGTTQTLTAGGQIDCRSNAIIPVAGSGGPVTLSSNPQLLTPTDEPTTKLCILEGTSNTNTLTLVDGNGVHLAGSPLTLELRTLVPLVYNGSTWVLLGTGGIGGGIITNTQLDDMPAGTVKGNNTGGPTTPIDLNAAQATAMLNVFSGAAKGLTPLSGGGSTNFLRADGTWSTPTVGAATCTGATSLASACYDGDASFGVCSWADPDGTVHQCACDFAKTTCYTSHIPLYADAPMEILNVEGDACQSMDPVTGLVTYYDTGTCLFPTVSKPFDAMAFNVGTGVTLESVTVSGWPGEYALDGPDSDTGLFSLVIAELWQDFAAGGLVRLQLTCHTITVQSGLTLMVRVGPAVCTAPGEAVAAFTAPTSGPTLTCTFGALAQEFQASNIVSLTTTGCAAGEKMQVPFVTEIDMTASWTTEYRLHYWRDADLSNRGDAMKRVSLFLSGLLLLLAAPSFAAIVAGPWLQAATTTQMVVMWESSDNVAGSVAYGPTTSYGTTVASTRVTVPGAPNAVTGAGEPIPDTPAILHTVRITGLAANTLYHYRVTSGAAVGTDHTFRTHKTSGTWRIVHMSDAQYWLLTQRQSRPRFDQSLCSRLHHYERRCHRPGHQ